MKIETGRLIIRSMKQGDLEAFAQLWMDPEVTYFMGGPRNGAELRNTLAEDLAASPAPTFDIWPVIEKESGKLIGASGVIDKEVDGKIEYEIIYVFAAKSWGKGYATEAAIALRDHAFKNLGLVRMIALIDPENTRSEKVATKAGLKYEKDTLRPGGKTMKVYALNF